jgi:acetylcholinesterase
LFLQILQSGSAASAGVFNASRRENSWQAFVAGTPSCVGKVATTQTLDCLRQANSSDIALGLRASLNGTDLSSFQPTLDGPKGLLPDLPSNLIAQGKLARVPFIAGTTLDEGEVWTLKFPE